MKREPDLSKWHKKHKKCRDSCKLEIWLKVKCNNPDKHHDKHDDKRDDNDDDIDDDDDDDDDDD